MVGSPVLAAALATEELFNFAQLESPPACWGDIFVLFPCFSFPGSKTMKLNRLEP